MIAMALLLGPSLIIADEATSALDVTLQVQILELFAQVRETRGTSILLVSHDLGVVAQSCDRVAVMYAGRVVESAPSAPLFAEPRHPYTRALIATAPSYEDRQRSVRGIPGRVPSLHEMPAGCAYADRCAHRTRPSAPILRRSSRWASRHDVRCVLYGRTTARQSPPSTHGDRRPTGRRRSGADGGHRRTRRCSRRTRCHEALPGAALDARPAPAGRARPRAGRRRRRPRAPPGRDPGARRRVGVGQDDTGLDPDAPHRGQRRRRSASTANDLRAARWPRDAAAALADADDPPGSDRQPVAADARRATCWPSRTRSTACRCPTGASPSCSSWSGWGRTWPSKFPYQLSGGQARRVSIARALALEPAVIVADEPTSGLDVSAAAGVLSLMKELRDRLGVSYLMITHDLNVVGLIADRIAVMYLGQVIEVGTAAQIFEDPVHPYTQGLLAAVPKIRDTRRRRRAGACPAARCRAPGGRRRDAGSTPVVRLAIDACAVQGQELVPIDGGHVVACQRWLEARRTPARRRPPCRWSCPRNTAEGGPVIGIGVLGLGSVFWSSYRPQIERLDRAGRVQLRAVYDVDERRRRDVAERLGLADDSPSEEALIERDDVDLVMVLTSMPAHGRLAIAAMEAGKHVLVEKPMATTLPEAAELVASRRGSVAARLRAPRPARTDVPRDVAPRPSRCHRRPAPRPGPLRVDAVRGGGRGSTARAEGSLFDLGCYNIMSLCGFMGSVRRVSAMMGTRLPRARGRRRGGRRRGGRQRPADVRPR